MAGQRLPAGRSILLYYLQQGITLLRLVLRKLALFVGVVAVAALILAGTVLAEQGTVQLGPQKSALRAVGGSPASPPLTPPLGFVPEGTSSLASALQNGSQPAGVCAGYVGGHSNAHYYQPFDSSSLATSCLETHYSP